ncbi:MAG: zf-HC2 domain-containing protein [Acidobacteria bacterium]|nr:MAG: zf-HC2 domain-containing protein [Acidobacteriota bacterium]
MERRRPAPRREEVPMDHDQVIDLLPSYVKRTLPPPLRREVEHHLERCAECRGARDVAEALREIAEEGGDDDKHPSSAEIVAFATGDASLTGGQLPDLRAHLESCPECADLVERVREVERRLEQGSGHGRERPVASAATGTGGWRFTPPVAIAASVALLVAGAAIGRALTQAPLPGGAVPLVLVAAPERGAREAIEVPAAPGLVMLAVELAAPPAEAIDAGMTARIVRDGREIWSAPIRPEQARESLARCGAVAVAVPGRTLRGEGLSLRLESRSGELLLAVPLQAVPAAP